MALKTTNPEHISTVIDRVMTDLKSEVRMSDTMRETIKFLLENENRINEIIIQYLSLDNIAEVRYFVL